MADWHQLVAGREGRQRAREDRAQRRLRVARRGVGVGEMVRPRTRGEDSTKLLLGMGRIFQHLSKFLACKIALIYYGSSQGLKKNQG